MFIAMADDWRIVVVKLADRLFPPAGCYTNQCSRTSAIHREMGVLTRCLIAA